MIKCEFSGTSSSMKRDQHSMPFKLKIKIKMPNKNHYLILEFYQLFLKTEINMKRKENCLTRYSETSAGEHIDLPCCYSQDQLLFWVISMK